jgi:hypothetical protein
MQRPFDKIHGLRNKHKLKREVCNMQQSSAISTTALQKITSY